MMFELDMRLPERVRTELISRVMRFPQFKAIVINAAYQSQRITKNEYTNNFEMPPYLVADNIHEYKKSNGKEGNIRNAYGLFSTNNGWYGAGNVSSEIGKIKAQVAAKNLKIVVKGVMCKEDALEAIGNGADAIWISNQGGAKAHSSPSSISVLKSISRAVKSCRKPETEIFIDSAITRGTDALKCLAYGANAVFIGRPIMWALNYNGQLGCE